MKPFWDPLPSTIDDDNFKLVQVRESPYLKHFDEHIHTMRFSHLAVAVVALLSSSPGVSTTDAFAPAKRAFAARTTNLPSTTSVVVEVPTTPIAGMKPGTSGLRKKVEVWQGIDGDKYYVENFIQSLLDTAKDKNEGVMPHTYVCLLSSAD